MRINDTNFSCGDLQVWAYFLTFPIFNYCVVVRSSEVPGRLRPGWRVPLAWLAADSSRKESNTRRLMQNTLSSQREIKFLICLVLYEEVNWVWIHWQANATVKKHRFVINPTDFIEEEKQHENGKNEWFIQTNSQWETSSKIKKSWYEDFISADS